MMLSMTGCSTSTGLAPVSRLPIVQAQQGHHYRVQRGDTLYSIAWAYQIDYRQLAAINHLSSPYRIWPGQQLQTKTVNHVTKQSNVTPLRHWYQPAQGHVVDTFTAKLGGNPGVNIAGLWQEPILASAPGRVVYSGAGLKAYGNLIIIKHNNSFLSAYAFNARNLVHVGDQVKARQKIALMGRDVSGRPVLHFEIRRDGQPVNPMRYIG